MIRKYRKGDIWKVLPQKEQVIEAHFLNEKEFMRLEAYSVCIKSAVVAVFGAVEDNGTVDCYALLGRNCRSQMLALVRFWQKVGACLFLRSDIKKFRCTVKKDFRQGRRLMRLLGFQPKAVLPNYFSGQDYQLFEREKL